MVKITTLILFCSVLAGCLPTVDITSSWKNPDVPSGTGAHQDVFIMALTKNAEAKKKIEESLAKAATKKGYKPIKSGDVLDESETITDTARIVDAIKKSGATAAFIVALLNTGNESRYVPGTGAYAPAMNSYFSDFGSYYLRTSAEVSTPGYYVQDKAYYLESNLYSVADRKLAWSAQSETYSPDGLKSFSKNFSKAMIRQMEKDGILKK